MGKKDGKPKRKALKARIEALEAELEALRAAAKGPKGPLVSPLAPEAFPDLPAIAGVRFATAQAGVKYKGRTDVLLAVCEPGTTAAGVFTTSATASAAVLDCREKLRGAEGGAGWAIVVNSGNANAFTGRAGTESVSHVCAAAGQATGLPPARVLTASTGVIGEPLPHDRITAAMGDLAGRLGEADLEAAARAIMTTDTYPKGASATYEIDGHRVTVSGVAKGSGMIAPDMATMLAYVFTDAAVDQPVLQEMLQSLTARTFNAITVDSDTSTSDTLVVAATGASGAPRIDHADAPGGAALREALGAVLHDLALQVVKDGEGATKLIEVRVTGASDDEDAWRVADAVANSPLIKTAVAGEDANWGRVVMAVGKSGAKADRDRLAIRFGDHPVAEAGRRADAYDEAAASAYMARDHIVIGVDLGLGEGAFTMWGCDLTYRYVEINADYRS